MGPLAITAFGCLLLYAAFSGACTRAGQIRRLELSEDHPGTVVLALGRSTAISFTARPEKVVPGSPQAIQINFLGSDLTVTPVSRNPGNLLVYTKTGRYVILFRVGNENSYDDVVKVSPVGKGRPIQLLTDSFRTVGFHVESSEKSGEMRGAKRKAVSEQIAVLMASNELEISSPDLKDLLSPIGAFRCKGCVLRGDSDTARISCIKPMSEIHCESKTIIITLKRVSS
jgi:hypothetical protein